jgi:hypothetical protein
MSHVISWFQCLLSDSTCAATLRVSAGAREVEAERRRHDEGRTRERLDVAQQRRMQRGDHAEEDERDYSANEDDNDAHAETLKEEPATQRVDDRTPAQRDDDEASARAELAAFAAGDRERMASRYHRGALLAEPMAGDVRWDVEELRVGAAEAVAEARWRGHDFGYDGVSSNPGGGGGGGGGGESFVDDILAAPGDASRFSSRGEAVQVELSWTLSLKAPGFNP